MRTIIINTLGAAFSRKDAYYLAFAPERLLWLESDLDRLHDCVQLIRDMRAHWTVLEDYSLIVLLDTDAFAESEYADQRERIREVLRAWLVHQLLMPLDELSETPLSATALFVGCRDRHGATSDVRGYCDMMRDPEALELEYRSQDGTVRVLKLTELLGRDSLPGEREETPDVPAAEPGLLPEEDDLDDRLEDDSEMREWLSESREKSRQDALERTVSEMVKRLQSFRPKRNSSATMEVSSAVFQSALQDRRALNADLQINLARLIESTDGSGVPDVDAVRAHTPGELAQLLADAEATLREQLEPDGLQPIYYKLNYDTVPESFASDMKVEMCRRLREKAADVPGIGDALKKLDTDDGDTISRYWETAEGIEMLAEIRRDLRKGMLSIARERKAFDDRYQQLREEYIREKVLDDQRKVFDICADSYSEWRAEMIGRRVIPTGAPTEVRRPILRAADSSELVEARKRCAKGVLSKLEDFADVRERAAELHTEFSAEARLWTPRTETGSMEKFYSFTVTMGIIFLVLMLLPFFLISSQANDLKLPRFFALLLNSGFFIAIYAAGVLAWMGALVRKIKSLREKLEILIVESALARMSSVRLAIRTYTDELPLCLIKQLNYNIAVETDARNKRASEKYEQHMRIIKDALDEISDIRTALRAESRGIEAKPSGKSIDLLRAPYDTRNREFYMLFTERE